MDRIYLHSHLTITALEPETCKQPFLGRQTFGEPTWQRRFLPEYTSATNPDAAPLEIFIREDTKETISADPTNRTSLDKRGWCLQEGLLPNRRLCFDGNEMMWECLRRKICECGHILWQPQHFRHGELGALLKSNRLKAQPVWTEPRPNLTWEEKCHHLNASANWMHRDAHYDRWRTLVTEYTGRSLSRQTDRLSALAGLAKLVGEDLAGAQTDINRLRGYDDPDDEVGPPNEHFAGLWRGEFLFDLTWVPLEPAARIENMPSWSWASVERKVIYRFNMSHKSWKYTPDLIHCAAVVSITCEGDCANTAPKSPLLAGGRVVLKGKRAPVRMAVVDVDGKLKIHVTPQTPP